MTSEDLSILRSMIRREVTSALNVLLMGKTDASEDLTESFKEFYPGAPSIGQRPKILPYGLASRAPEGTNVFTGRVGEHPGARAVLGHWDKDRPEIESGETVLYNQFGQRIYLQDGKILLGSESATQPAVLGTVLKTMLSTLLTQIATHTHIGNLGYPTTVPANAAAFTALKSDPVDNGAVLSDEVFLEKTNGT